MPATDIKLMFELVKYSGVARAWRLGAKRWNGGLEAGIATRTCASGLNCKRQRREAAIAEGKKPLTTRGSGGAS